MSEYLVWRDDLKPSTPRLVMAESITDAAELFAIADDPDGTVAMNGTRCYTVTSVSDKTSHEVKVKGKVLFVYEAQLMSAKEKAH